MVNNIHISVENFFDKNTHLIPIAEALKSDFEITWANEGNNFNTIVFALILKPKSHMKSAFGFSREILCVYSPYNELQARAIQSADSLMTQKISIRERVEPILYILISDDIKIQDSLKSFPSADGSNNRVIIPFNKTELIQSKTDSHFIRNRFRTYLYERDLFDSQTPIVSDAFYFGRKQFTPQIIDRISNGQNTGVFGLRKTGKTSLLKSVERALLESEKQYMPIYIDAEGTSIYNDRWDGLIHRIISSMYNLAKVSYRFSRNQIDELNAEHLLVEAVNDLTSGQHGFTRIVVIIDEIENISYFNPSAIHWKKDFMPFWACIRAVAHSVNQRLCIIVAGVNAKMVEDPLIVARDNPIFEWISPLYIPYFSVQEVRDMVRTLGKPMGLDFQEDVFEYLTVRYGGHPYLIRKVCSWIHKQMKGKDRPIEITKSYLINNEEVRDKVIASLVDQVISLLSTWYADEYEMLRLLSQNDESDKKLFVSIAHENPQEVIHLFEYGLLRDELPFPKFTIAAVQRYMRNARPAVEAKPENSILVVHQEGSEGK